ncbi:MAG: hypothetical protein Q9160_006185 [Pyrenula sp. 1 TL-2023]
MFSRPITLFALAVQTNLLIVQCLQPDIRADTNRDGRVDMRGTTDIAGNKSAWTTESGAIFLPNIGDSNRRCPNTDLQNNPLSNDELAYCSDASGHLMFSPQYLAPLRTVPMPSVSDSAKAYIYATPDAAYDRVRLFLNDDPSNANSTTWKLIDKEFRFNSTYLKNGVMLGIDGREVVRNAAVWDGSVNQYSRRGR